MIEDQFPSILYKVGEEEWEFEAYDISYEIICRFISNLKGFKHDFHFRTDDEMNRAAINATEYLQPQTLKKLIDAIKLHTDARKYCKKQLGRLRRMIRKVVCLSPKLHNTIVVGENMLSVPNIILINISVLENFVSWYNKYQQHGATIENLRKSLETFEPVMETAEAQLPTPSVKIEQVLAEDHPNVFQKNGEIWILRFKGKDAHPMKHSVGMIYIKQLLMNPHHPFYPYQLVSSVNRDINIVEDEEDNEKGSSDSSPKKMKRQADNITLSKYKKGLAVLEEKLAEAESLEEKEELEIKIKEVNNLIFSGKFKEVNPEDLKAANSVRTAIKRTINEIKNQDNALSEHFSKSIKTGLNTIYQPSEKIDWLV